MKLPFKKHANSSAAGNSYDPKKPESALNALRDGTLPYYAVPKELRDDRAFMLAAVKENANVLYSAEKLKDDPDVVLAAVQQSGMALQYASEFLRGDRKIVMAAVQKDGAALQRAATQLQDDLEIVAAAVRQKGKALEYASDTLKANRDIVLAAVQKDGTVLKYASERLKADHEVVLAAVQQNAVAISAAAEELRAEPDIVLAAVRQNGMALEYASPDLRNNTEIVSASIRQNWRACKYASDELKKNQELFRLTREQRAAQSSKKSQSLNFLWLNLDLPAPPDPADGSIRMPLPEEYIENAREAGRRHPHADINVWFDSRRLTQKQWDYLGAVLEGGMDNVRVKDLAAIPEYINEELYSRTETKKNWRGGYYQGVVWLQVDAAKILISLQGDYDQHFFADFDHGHVDIDSAEVQKMLDKHGLMIGGSDASSTSLENQLWGFDRSRMPFFESYNADGLQMAYQGAVAYGALGPKVYEELREFEDLKASDIVLPIGSIGLAHAVQPGHENTGSAGYEGRTRVSAKELKTIFNGRASRIPEGLQTSAVARATATNRPGLTVIL